MSKAKELNEWMGDFLERVALSRPDPLSYNKILGNMMNDVMCAFPSMDATPGSVIHTLMEAVAKSHADLYQHIDHLNLRINELEKQNKTKN